MSFTETDLAGRYARSLLLVLDDPEIGGGPAAFDMAVTNGLVAIVNAEWPGAHQERGRVKSARELLGVIESKIPSADDGTIRLPGFSDYQTVVDLEALRRGITETQAPRHGRAARNEGVPGDVLKAAEALDSHPSLRSLDRARADEYERRTNAADWAAVQQASAYWERLSDAERARRADRGYVEEHLPWRPEDQYSMPDVQVCDVCETEAFFPDGWDIYGGDRSPGTCLACSYYKSEGVAEDEAMMAKLEYELGKPD